MIEINLIEQRKKFKAPVVLGIDLAKIPWLKIIISYIIAVVPLSFVEKSFVGQLEVKEANITELNTKLNKLKRDIKKKSCFRLKNKLLVCLFMNNLKKNLNTFPSFLIKNYSSDS